ncbi:hypothetical protein LTR85_003358 [Meristemomyces frigidus]|nr:hypothetical protein LTR85_003358 [Meristemomyces frigidus]
MEPSHRHSGEEGNNLLESASIEEQPNQVESPEDANRTTEAEFHRVRRLLYTSHFFSTWNSRTFEFGAFLFLAAIYPHTLLPASGILGPAGLASLCILASVEKQGIILNTVSVERDWVVVVAEGDEARLSTLNSQMRRIDLFCKLVAPLAVSLLDAVSSELAIAVTGLLPITSVSAEYFAIARVYRSLPALAIPRATKGNQQPAGSSFKLRVTGACSGVLTYVRHQAFLPSFALALLYLTVLSFAGQMITYLLAIGLSSSAIGALRGVAALSELSATWLGPKIMERIGPIRAGIWFLNWQMMCVTVACIFFWLDAPPTVVAVGTISAVVASRIGLWGFDLSAQMIVQEEVEAELRGTFSSQEFAFQNIFEMLSFASTIVFARPDQFKYPATISAGAVALAGVLYAAFVRMRRGHLVHLSKCMDRDHRKKYGWSRVEQDEGGEGHELVGGERA